MLRLLPTRRRLIRKNMYRAPHERHRKEYFRENKNLVKNHQNEFKNSENIDVKLKRRPKREVQKGFKMSYRYKYYNIDIIEEEEDES